MKFANLLLTFIGLLLIASSNESLAGENETFSLNYTNGSFVAALLSLIILTLLFLNGTMKSLRETLSKAAEGSVKDKITSTLAETGEKIRVIAYLSALFLFLYLTYQSFQGTKYEAHVNEWMNLMIRWAHVVFGIAWIGASFYFNFLENSLNRTENLRDELAGNLWAIHGGGFYYLEKYKIAPKEIPKHLHWFKYEAYFTWLTGFLLLIVVYYLDAKVYLIDPEVLAISSQNAVTIGIGSLFLGWLIYDLLCKSPLAKKPTLFWFILFLFLAGFAWFFLHVFSGRAAYIHVGALIGTMMVGNVFRVIIPAQKAMVNSAKQGVMPNPVLGKNALLRSRHNNYLTLPVIFIMISNHFPTTHGGSLNWYILIGLSLCSVLIKHYLNKMEKGDKAVWIMPVAVVGMIAMAIISVPKTEEVCSEDAPATYQQVRAIIDLRCVQCHSATPTDDVVKVAPNGVMFDTKEQCINMADRILNRAVQTKTMPQANKTEMTQQERNVVQCWIEGGAKE